MAVNVNDGSVLKTLGAVSVNDGGVIRNLGSVSANDGGVIREIFSAGKVKINGITPLIAGDNFMVINRSGSFTLTAPAGARIVIAGGGQNGQKSSSDSGLGGSGGFVAEYKLTSDVKNANCTVTLGGATEYSRYANSSTLSSSTLQIGSNTYSSGSVVRIIQTKWGPIGGNGGEGYYCGSGGRDNPRSSSPNGTGAGGGGGGISKQYGGDYYGIGGNTSGYGNRGGNGSPKYSGGWGSSGVGGGEDPTNSSSGTQVGGGGGGGYGAGGGGNACQESVWYDSESDSNEYDYGCSSPGSGGAGILIIEW